MMRPTESSKSKTHEKVEVKSPQRKTHEKVEAKTPPKMTIRPKGKSDEVGEPKKERVRAVNGAPVEAKETEDQGEPEQPADAEKEELGEESMVAANGDAVESADTVEAV